ncbi:glycosyl hydrolase family 28-related protein [Jiangella mangrovi]|uniref:Pectate lyase superfamily protein domain-containing protein n=1 Tax=Jiangella mangrovi TaxID=1524084 RepID=A0A7W9GWH3_9ACTN|nr:glycosyl hydrolase family 28-related protein [Jiangella mangrovi]MBB5791257.1 hypothetical protein [Jiangella mangrovi]
MATYDTIADLKAASVPADGTLADVLGYWEAGDGGDGRFVFDSGSTKDDNAGTYIAPTSGSGRWHRIIENGTMSAKAWGAHIDNLTDDAPALQNALDFMAHDTPYELYLPAGDYDIRSPLSYVTSGHSVGPQIRGAGHRQDAEVMGPVGTALHWRFTGHSLLRISNDEPQRFNEGGYLRDFGIDAEPRPGDPDLPPNSQAAGIELSNWWLFSIESVSIIKTHGHGIWAPTRFTAIDISVSDGGNPLSGADQRRPNDKPYAWVDNTGNRHGSMAEILAHVDIDGGAIQGFLIRRAGFGYQVNDPVRVTGTGSGFEGHVSAVDANGGITAIVVDENGSGYDTDTLYNNEDAFNVAGFTFREVIIVGNDGWGVSMPHFASGGHLYSCYIVDNKMHGVIVGGNSTHIIGGAVASNGVHPTAGFFPGIWVRRGYSSVNGFRTQGCELDGNGYAHICFDGASGALVEDTRMNSWVTIRPDIVPRIGQLPPSQVKFDIGNYRVANNGIKLSRCIHRAQPNDGFVATSPVATSSGNDTVTFTEDHAANPILDFYPGVTVKIVKSGGTLVTFAGGGTTTTVESVDYDNDEMVLENAPTETLAIGAGAVIKEAIGDNNVNWYDFGRTIANAAIKVEMPVPSQLPATYTKFANLDDTQPFALIDVQDWTLDRPHMVGGNNTTLARVPGAAEPALGFVVPTTAVDVPFTQVIFDPYKRMQVVSDAPTGRYFVKGSGVYQVNGTLALSDSIAGDVIQVSVIQRTITLDENGVPLDPAAVPNPTDVVLSDFRRVCTGALSTNYPESFTFEASVAAIQRDTYLGATPPPGVNSGDAGLLWFNQQTKVLKRWSGTAWAVMPGWTTAYNPTVTLSVRVRSFTSARKLTHLSGRNTVCFNQIH